jgi:hypothetical protein
VIPLTDLNTGHTVTYTKQLHDYVSAGGHASRGREVTGRMTRLTRPADEQETD